MWVSARPAVCQVLPASVGLVHAVPGDESAADIAIARADVDDLRVRRRDRDGADAVAGTGKRFVRDVAPAHAVIGALPDAAVDGAHVEQVALGGHSRDRDDAAADVRTDRAPLELGIRPLGGRRGSGAERREQERRPCHGERPKCGRARRAGAACAWPVLGLVRSGPAIAVQNRSRRFCHELASHGRPYARSVRVIVF